MLKWNIYAVSLSFRERIVGGIPTLPTRDANGYAGWLKGQGLEAADIAELAPKLADDPDMPEEAEPVEATATGFRRTPDGEAYIEARQVKAMLKEAAQRLGIVKRVRGSKQVLQHDLHVRGEDGTQMILLNPAPVEVKRESRPISVITIKGPRTSLKEFEYVEAPTLDFHVYLLADGIGDGLIDEAKLRDMLELGQDLGLGADRSQGEGTFDVLEIEYLGQGELSPIKQAVSS